MTVRTPLRRWVKLVNGGTPTSDADNWGGCFPWATPVDLARADGGTLGETDRTLTPGGVIKGSNSVPLGSLILSTRAPIGYVVRVDRETAFNQGCKGLVPGPGLDARFLQLWLWSSKSFLQARGSGSTFLELGSDALMSFEVPVPPVNEQRRIADFLDDQVARVDNVIASRQRQAGLMREEALSAVEAQFTATYERTRPLATLTDPRRPIQYGIVLPGPHFEGGVPIVKGGDIASGRLRLGNLNRTDPEIEAKYPRSRLRVGDFVMAIRGSVGESDKVPPGLDGANLTQDTARIAAFGCDSSWLCVALDLPSVQSDIRARVTGATIPGINIEALRRVRIPDTPYDKQPALAHSAGAVLRRAEQSEEALARSVRLLEELKRSLITAAVSGEFDVSAADGSRVPA